MVAIGIMSVMTLALLSILDNMNKGQKRATGKDAALNLSNEIRSILVDSPTCRVAFVFNGNNAVTFPAAPANGTDFALNQITAFGRAVVTSNALIPGTVDLFTPPTSNATGLRLRLIGSVVNATPGFTNWDTQLIVPIRVGSPTGAVTYRDLTFNVIMTTANGAPTVIAGCSASSNLTEETICQNVLGGVYDVARIPTCRVPQVLHSTLQYRDQLSADPGGAYTAVETPIGSRGLTSFGPAARVSLFRTEDDFTTTPANGVVMRIPADNVMKVEATGGTITNGSVQVRLDDLNAAAPNIAISAFSAAGNSLFQVGSTGRLTTGVTSAAAAAWNNFGTPAAGAGNILNVYNNTSTAVVAVSQAGNFGIGSPNPALPLDVRGAGGDTISWGPTATGGSGFLSFAGSSAAIRSTVGGALSMGSNNRTNDLTFAIANSDATFTGTIFAPALITPSDSRLKKKIQPLGFSLNKILNFKAYSYVYKDDQDQQTHFGFLAEDVQKEYPELVQQNQDGYLSVNYVEMIPVLIKALQESEARVKILEHEVLKIKKLLQKNSQDKTVSISK